MSPCWPLLLLTATTGAGGAVKNGGSGGGGGDERTEAGSSVELARSTYGYRSLRRPLADQSTRRHSNEPRSRTDHIQT